MILTDGIQGNQEADCGEKEASWKVRHCRILVHHASCLGLIPLYSKYAVHVLVRRWLWKSSDFPAVTVRSFTNDFTSLNSFPQNPENQCLESM
jgi:hypothetical protein